MGISTFVNLGGHSEKQGIPWWLKTSTYQLPIMT